MAEITRKQVCKCENCGNEAEMILTCSLEDVDTDTGQQKADAGAQGRHVPARGTCSHCGNEADMWIDL